MSSKEDARASGSKADTTNRETIVDDRDTTTGDYDPILDTLTDHEVAGHMKVSDKRIFAKKQARTASAALRDPTIEFRRYNIQELVWGRGSDWHLDHLNALGVRYVDITKSSAVRFFALETADNDAVNRLVRQSVTAFLKLSEVMEHKIASPEKSTYQLALLLRLLSQDVAAFGKEQELHGDNYWRLGKEFATRHPYDPAAAMEAYHFYTEMSLVTEACAVTQRADERQNLSPVEQELYGAEDLSNDTRNEVIDGRSERPRRKQPHRQGKVMSWRQLSADEPLNEDEEHAEVSELRSIPDEASFFEASEAGSSYSERSDIHSEACYLYDESSDIMSENNSATISRARSSVNLHKPTSILKRIHRASTGSANSKDMHANESCTRTAFKHFLQLIMICADCIKLRFRDTAFKGNVELNVDRPLRAWNDGFIFVSRKDEFANVLPFANLEHKSHAASRGLLNQTKLLAQQIAEVIAIVQARMSFLKNKPGERKHDSAFDVYTLSALGRRAHITVVQFDWQYLDGLDKGDVGAQKLLIYRTKSYRLDVVEELKDFASLVFRLVKALDHEANVHDRIV